jgi:hypothetical protein
MNHAITIGDLLLCFGALIGVVCAAIGILMFAAGGMSDAPELGDAAAKQGCVTALVGLTVLVGCMLWLLH